MKTVHEIVTRWLESHGYDGLYSDDECACLVGSLFPCCSDFSSCKPGHKQPCDCGEHDYHVGDKADGNDSIG